MEVDNNLKNLDQHFQVESLRLKVALYSYLAREAWARKWRERASV